MSSATNRQNPETPTGDARRGGPSIGGRLSGYRRVEWVRMSDLGWRTGSRVIEQGARINQQLRQLLAEARRDGIQNLRSALRDRGREIEADAPNRAAAGQSAQREQIDR